MKTIICTIGNRDLQIPVNANINELNIYFTVNNDDVNYKIIKKSDHNLYEVTKELHEKYDSLKDCIRFPLIEKALSHIPDSNKKLILVDTNQDPPDKQDTHYIALLAQKHLKSQGIETIIQSIDFNPTDFEKLFTHFTSIFDKYSGNETSELFCANSGGTPQMKTASEFAGLFRNIQYITINARTETSLSNFKKQERIVLKHTIEKMVKVFAYEGIALLPVIPDRIRQLCEIALERLSLDFKSAIKAAGNLDNNLNNNLLEILKQPKDKIDILKQMYLSAKVKFVQKSYGDYLWRLFSIHDNIFQKYVEKYFGSKIKYCEEDNHAEWNNLLKSRKELLAHLENCTIGSTNSKLNYSSPNKYVCFEILKYSQKTNNKLIPEEEFRLLEKIHLQLDRLGKLRNAIAHNLKGIGLNDIKKKLSNISLYEFNNLLANYFKIPENEFGEFDMINKEIVDKSF